MLDNPECGGLFNVQLVSTGLEADTLMFDSPECGRLLNVQPVLKCLLSSVFLLPDSLGESERNNYVLPSPRITMTGAQKGHLWRLHTNMSPLGISR